MNERERPGVGVGTYIFKDGKVLIGKRKGLHEGGTWCAPGGHLEMGESWEDCARREVAEETGIEIENVRYVGVTNDIFSSGKHYITIAMAADWKSGEPQLLEPDKFEGEWKWFDWDSLPSPLFSAFENFLKLKINPLEF